MRGAEAVVQIFIHTRALLRQEQDLTSQIGRAESTAAASSLGIRQRSVVPLAKIFGPLIPENAAT